ncbi:sulfite exporter TauE/SafE family protein [Paenibacillaceae bacterium WGS1546]|uniref:sulfite exporter TauE/SafE family protein n=1 Tax=Cohnella sp. WGS1546 TaxID=3366810 RepID=UPI00372D6805
MTAPADLLLVALAGLAGAPHCLIMCGGISSSMMLNARRNPFRIAAAYHSGRITTYALVGGTMGFAGSFLNAAGRFVGLQGAASIVGGALILAWTYWRYAMPYQHRFSRLGAKPLAAAAAFRNKHEWAGTYATGLLLGLLPCGLTYAMQMNAAASGSGARGALILLVFGLSTLPVFAALALFAGKLGKAQRRGMRAAGAALAYAMGVLAMLKGASANGWIPSVHPWLW